MNDFNQYEVHGSTSDESIYMLHHRCGDIILDRHDMFTVEEQLTAINEHRENCGKTNH